MTSELGQVGSYRAGLQPNQLSKHLGRLIGPSTMGMHRVALVMPKLPLTMLRRVEQWEISNDWRVHDGLDPLPAPYAPGVMNLLERLNRMRNDALRRQAAEQRKHHEVMAAQAKKQQLKKPNISGRVLRERRERTERTIADRRAAAERDAIIRGGGTPGPAGGQPAGSGGAGSGPS